jgi:hypothetical protein
LRAVAWHDEGHDMTDTAANASATQVPGGPAIQPAAVQPAAPAAAAAATEITGTWTEGATDRQGRKITCIYRVTKQFVIYEADGTTTFVLPDDYETAKALRAKIAELGGLLAKIEMLKSLSALPDADKGGASSVEAWALSVGFEDGPIDQAKAALVNVDARLRTLAKSELRKTYVYATLAAVIVIEAILVAIAYMSWSLPGTFSAMHRYAAYCAAGGLGALLSAIAGAQKLDMNLDVAVWEHFLAGASRILIGVIGGLVVGLALDSHFMDPTLGGTASTAPTPGMINRTVAMYLLFTFVSGFSETLVPNLLARGEQAALADHKTTPPPAAPHDGGDAK